MWTGLVLLFLAQLFSAVTPTAIKFGVISFSPILFTFLRFMLASIFIVPLFFIIKENKKHLGKRQIFHMLFLGFIFFSFAGLYSIGIKYTTVIMGAIIFAASPLVVGLFGLLFLREKFSKQQAIGLFIALIGMTFLIFESFAKQQLLTFGTFQGNSLMVIGMFGYSYYILYSRRLSKQFSSSSISLVSFMGTAFWAIPFLIPEIASGQMRINISSGSILSLIIAAFIGSTLSYTLLQFGIAKTNAFTAALFQYLNPVLAGIVAVLVLHEKPTIAFIVGGFVILLGVFYATTYGYVKRYLVR